MSQSGKASIKRGKPSYFMSILGVTLVLLLLGIIGWLVINANKLGNYFKENVEVRAYLRGDLNPKDSVALMTYISGKPYVKSIEYITKEAGKKIYMVEENEEWNKVLDANPLPNAIYFKVKRQYVTSDSLQNIKNDLEQQTYISDAAYPDALVGRMNKNIRNVSIGFLLIAIIISLVVIFLIDNTIRLAMFSNRFLIKTMQMVGATRWFIAKPMDRRAIINGAISGIIATAAIIGIIFAAETWLPDMKALRDNMLLAAMFAVINLLGICI